MAQCYSNTCVANRSRSATRSVYVFPFYTDNVKNQVIHRDDLVKLKESIALEAAARNAHADINIVPPTNVLADETHARFADLQAMKDSINELISSDNAMDAGYRDLLDIDVPGPDSSGVTVGGYITTLMSTLNALRQDCICNGDCGANLMCSCHSNCSSNCSDY